MSLRYEFCPPDPASGVDHLGTYKRQVPVNLDRMYENALDWEHLPHLHSGSFSAIECVDAGAWGWRCRVYDKQGQESLLELRLDRSCRRWITRNLEGPSRGAEIWTHVFVVAERALDLVIDYFVPGIDPAAREKVGRAYAAAYEVLYDEDVEMMSERQRMIDQRIDSVFSDDVLQLSVPERLPHLFELSGRSFFLDRLQTEWVVYPTTCPHQLGPLQAMDERGEVPCPWHGYRFDVKSGACVTGAACHFGQVPVVSEASLETVTLSWKR